MVVPWLQGQEVWHTLKFQRSHSVQPGIIINVHNDDPWVIKAIKLFLEFYV